ncbi:MAG: hypothetical protein CVU84_05665 [Firmicutes bacterium HGW-Firmicutes-1]|jgi:beta-lactamase regulating signal transducer with metallopeptidase domain|nr:MAG: hypothetical protein CVU84_05665 [Firmicutes bacterium HGW-Firmicutes-1]
MHRLFDLSEINQVLYNCLIYFVEISIKGSVGILIAISLYRLRKQYSSIQIYKLLLVSILGMIIIPLFFYVIPVTNPITFTVEPYLSYNSYIVYRKLPISEDSIDIKYNKDYQAIEPKTDTYLPTILPIVWLIGVLFCTFRIIIGLYGIHKIVKNCDRIIAYDYHEDNLINSIKKTLKIKRPVKIIESSCVSSPVTFGVIKPLIILPSQCALWTDERWIIVLTHEMFHIKNFDSIHNLFVQALCAVFWFNPLISKTGRILREEREGACDDFVIKSGITPHIYATHLIEMIRMSSSQRLINNMMTGMSNNSGVERRIRKIIDTKKQENLRAKSVTGVSAFVISIVLSFYTIDFVFANENSESGVFDVIFNNDLVTVNYEDNDMKIIDALPQDIPTFSPLGENGEGEALNYYSKNDKWSYINSNAQQITSLSNIPIYASANGIIKRLDSVTSYSGQTNITIIIQHKHKLSSIYGCINETSLKEGDFVQKGDIIGYDHMGQICYKINYGSENIAPFYFLEKDKLISSNSKLKERQEYK